MMEINVMRPWVLLSVIIGAASIALFNGSVYSQGPPMVEKHIFSLKSNTRESPRKGEPSGPREVDRAISFTGVIISPQGKRAMIKEGVRSRGRQGTRSNLYKEGDEIDGMILKEIGSNYIVLLREGKEVRLRLYKGGKKRPAPPFQPRAKREADKQKRRQKRPVLNIPKKAGPMRGPG